MKANGEIRSPKLNNPTPSGTGRAPHLHQRSLSIPGNFGGMYSNRTFANVSSSYPPGPYNTGFDTYGAPPFMGNFTANAFTPPNSPVRGDPIGENWEYGKKYYRFFLYFIYY